MKFALNIERMEATTDGKTVQVVHYSMTATEGDEKAVEHADVRLDPPAAGAKLTPFAKLTPEQVLGWVLNAAGEQNLKAMEQRLAKAIAERKRPAMQSLTPPWEKTEKDAKK